MVLGGDAVARLIEPGWLVEIEMTRQESIYFISLFSRKTTQRQHVPQDFNVQKHDR
jgi:hypothetical protein